MDFTDYTQPNELRAQPARSLLLRLWGDISSLVEQEVSLVRTEVAELRGPLVRAATRVGLAIVLGFVAVACLAFALIEMLRAALGLPLAALFVGLLFAGAAFWFANALRKEAESASVFAMRRSSDQLPKFRPSHKTLAEQEADIAWTRRRIDETLTALERKADLGKPLRDTAVGVGALGVAVANIVREDSRTRS